MMKKGFCLFLLVCLTFIFTACKPREEDPPQSSEEESPYDLGGAEFIIMADTPNYADPRSSEYEGLYQIELQKRIEFVEQKYNIQVVYKPYPTEANWGVNRENWIIQSVITGNPGAHVYELSGSSIPVVASAGALMPLKQYIDKYDDGVMNKKTEEFGYFKGDYYVYDSRPAQNTIGLYYNQDLLEEHGYEPDYPLQLYRQGKWNWDTFEKLVRELNDRLDENKGEYPMAGLTYEWAYQFIAANGGYMVNKHLNIGLDQKEAMEAMEFLAKLYAIRGMWIDEALYWYGTEPAFKDGKAVFQVGEWWWLFYDSRLGVRSFERVGYVPIPTGPSTKEDLSNYHNVIVFGPGLFALSAGYEKKKVPTGYENMVFDEEIIFQIWRDMQYFGDDQDYYEDFAIDLIKYYAAEQDVDAHLEVMDVLYNDLLYSINEQGHIIRNDYVLKIEEAIQQNNVRATIDAIVPSLASDLITRYGV